MESAKVRSGLAPAQLWTLITNPCPITIGTVQRADMISISDANDRATVLADADIFFSRWFQASDADEVNNLNAAFNDLANGAYPGDLWYIAAFPAALIQVYDLVLALDLNQAGIY